MIYSRLKFFAISKPIHPTLGKTKLIELKWVFWYSNQHQAMIGLDQFNFNMFTFEINCEVWRLWLEWKSRILHTIFYLINYVKWAEVKRVWKFWACICYKSIYSCLIFFTRLSIKLLSYFQTYHIYNNYIQTQVGKNNSWNFTWGLRGVFTSVATNIHSMIAIVTYLHQLFKFKNIPKTLPH